MKKIIVLVLSMVLAGCAASVDIQKISLESGRVYEVAKTRSGVEFADCGTQLVSYLFDEKGTLVDSKSERGHALHCDLSVAVINAGATVGAANQIRRGIAAGADSITNNNSNASENKNVNAQAQAQGQVQGQFQESTIKVKDITGNNGGHHDHKGGNNGKGNGGGDGSPNGKSDEGR